MGKGKLYSTVEKKRKGSVQTPYIVGCSYFLDRKDSFQGWMHTDGGTGCEWGIAEVFD